MAAKPKLTIDQRKRIADVLAIRMELPSDKELARDFGVSVWAIRWHMTQILQSIVDSRAAKAGKLTACQPAERSVTRNASAS